jgi:hypothetical protein
MDLVPALRQFNSQLGCNHATATIGGITGNTNFHPDSGSVFAAARSCDPPRARRPAVCCSDSPLVLQIQKSIISTSRI